MGNFKPTAVFGMKAGVFRLLAAALVGVTVASSPRGGTASGPFDLMRGWSGGPWQYQYPWAGNGYPSFGFGAPYTWDQPLGFGQAGPYVWGAPFASPSLFLPGEPADPTPEAETRPQDATSGDRHPVPEGQGAVSPQ